MLAPVTEAHFGEEALVRLNLLSAERYPAFVAELEDATEVDCGYVRCGTLMVARDADDNEALAQLFDFQQRLGLEADRLTGRECRDLEPGLAPSVRGGIFVAGDHQVDNRALTGALRRACDISGVSFVQDRVARVQVDHGRAVGLSLESEETIPADSVVIASGSQSGELEGLPPDVLPPVRPVKGQLLQLRSRGRFLERNLRGLDVYLVSRTDGRLVVGATMEERGFDEVPTAEAVYLLLRDAYELMPGVLDCDFTEVAVGLRPATPDNAPLIGDTSIEGLYLATGHFRNGLLLAPITADALAERLTTGKLPEAVASFSPQRFAESEVLR